MLIAFLSDDAVRGIFYRNDLFCMLGITCIQQNTSVFFNARMGNILFHVRRRQIKMQFSYLHFIHPNILRTSDEF